MTEPTDEPLEREHRLAMAILLVVVSVLLCGFGIAMLACAQLGPPLITAMCGPLAALSGVWLVAVWTMPLTPSAAPHARIHRWRRGQGRADSFAGSTSPSNT